VRRLETDAAWAETPPSRTRHYVSNLLIGPGSRDDELLAATNFMITRTRGEQGYQLFTGRREDTLRRAGDDSFRIAKRRILVDQTVITATNLSILF
jgi:3-phenylpropionate/cinnamic acid dioxygenase small subunit